MRIWFYYVLYVDDWTVSVRSDMTRQIRGVELSNGVDSLRAILYDNGVMVWSVKGKGTNTRHNMDIHSFEEWLGDYRFTGWHTVTIED